MKKLDRDSPAVAPVEEPDEYPVSFDEWAQGKHVLWRIGIGGYRCAMKIADDTAPRLRAAWDEGFEAFLKQTPA